MTDALRWPTNREEIPHATQAPSTKYRFAFEEGLAQQIVADAMEAAPKDSQSPLVGTGDSDGHSARAQRAVPAP